MNTRNGMFGEFGGQYVPDFLLPALEEVATAYEKIRQTEAFQTEFAQYLRQYVGRPSLLYAAENLSRHLGGATIYLKREDLNHTGSHKINNAIGQARTIARSDIAADIEKNIDRMRIDRT